MSHRLNHPIHTYLQHLQNISDPLYQFLFQDSHFILLIIDSKTGHILDANKKACQFYGYSYETLTFLNINQIDILEKTRVSKILKQTMNTEDGFYKFKHMLANGIIKDVEVFTYIVEYSQQNCVFCIIQDITEKVYVETNLEMAYEELDQIFNHSANPKLVLDVNHRAFRVNQAYADLIGQQKDELIGENCQVICPIKLCLKDREKENACNLNGGCTEHTNTRCPVEQALKGEKVHNREVCTTINEELYYFKISSIPLLYKQEVIVGVLLTFQDISEKKRQVKELLEQKNYLKKLANQMKNNHEKNENILKISPIPVLWHNHGIIKSMNDAACKLLKVKREQEVIGQNILEFIHDDFKNRAQELLTCIEFRKEFYKIVDQETNIIEVEMSSIIMYEEDQLTNKLFIVEKNKYD